MPNIVGFKIEGSTYEYDHGHLANLPTIDAEPTANSTNAVQSGGVKSALDGLQAEIPTVDATPIQGSSNAVSSGGVYNKFSELDDVVYTEKNEEREAKNLYEQASDLCLLKLDPNAFGVSEILYGFYVPVDEYRGADLLISRKYSGSRFRWVFTHDIPAAGVGYVSDKMGSDDATKDRILNVPQNANYLYVAFYSSATDTRTMEELLEDMTICKLTENNQYVSGFEKLCLAFSSADTAFSQGTSMYGFYVPVDKSISDTIFVERTNVGTRFRFAFTVDVPAVGTAFTGYENRDTGRTPKFTIPDGANYLYIAYYSSTNDALTEAQLLEGFKIRYAVPAIETVVVNVSRIEIIEEDVDSLNSDVSDLEEELAEYINRPKIPAYYYENDYFTDKVQEIRDIGLSLGKQSGRFFFITDYHISNNAKNSPLLIAELGIKTAINRTIFGGDAIQSYTTKEAAYSAITDFIESFADTRARQDIYYITGNHETNNPSLNPDYTSRMIPLDAIYRIFNGQMHDVVNLDDTGNSFYFDDTSAKVRYYCIGCKNNSTIGDIAKRGFGSTLEDVPDGYAVIIISHVGNTYDSEQHVIGVRETFVPILDIAKAFHDGEAVTITDIGTFDYTGKTGYFLGALIGHCHYDSVILYDSRFPIISTTCDAYQLVNTNFPRPDRIAGTIHEQAFDVVQFDVDTGYIYLTRIGDGDNRTIKCWTDAGLVE